LAGWKKILLEGDAAAPSDNAPQDTDFLDASAGVGANCARDDHKHDVPEALVGDIAAVDGSAAATGSANKFVRADHVHALGPLVADLDFGKNNANNMALHAAADAPADPVDGQVYYDTTGGDLHPYIYQA